MRIHKRNLKNKITAMMVAVAMVFTLIPSATFVYADAEYDFQPPDADANEKQSVKLLEPSPSEISVIEETEDHYLNRINTVVDGTEDIEFSLTMTAGINNFNETNFKVNNMPVIKIYNEDGSVAADYSDGLGKLKFLGSELSDEINNHEGYKTRMVMIGVDQGVLESGSYILEFNKSFCGNNKAKTLGKDIRFEFSVRAYPDLETMISDAEEFISVVSVGAENGDYSQEAYDVFLAAINTAKAELEAINNAAETGTISETEAENQKNAASEKLHNALKEFKNARMVSVSEIIVRGISSQQFAGDKGTASAVVSVDPDEEQYKDVFWESSDNIIIDRTSGKWTAIYAGEGWIRAVSAADNSAAETVEVKVLNEEGSVSFTYGAGKSLNEVLGDDLSGVSALKLFAVNEYEFQQSDLDEIRAAIPELKRIDMDNINATEIGEGWFKGWTSLEEVVLPENTVEIGNEAFYGCTNLKEIAIPVAVETIGNSAFAGCTSLNSTLTVMAANPPELADNAAGDVFNGLDSDKPASVTTFEVPYGSKADYENADVWNRYTYVEMDEKILEVEFTEVGGLKSAAEAALKAKGWDDNEITTLSITSPEGVYMEKVTDVKYLQNNFLGVTTLDLKGTAFKENNMQANTFEGRRNMRYIELPEGLTHMGKKSLYGCTNLRALTIPEGIATTGTNPGIGEGALAECPRLETLVMLPLYAPVYNASLPTSLKTIYVPNIQVDHYKDKFSSYRDIIKPIVSVSSEAVSVEAMQTKKLTASVESAVPIDLPLRWETVGKDEENPVVEVDKETGVLTACRYGTAKVTVTAGYNTSCECSCTFTVTVTKGPAVSLSAARASYNSIKLSWGAMSRAEGYQIFRATSKDGTYSAFKTVSASTKTYTDTGLTTGKYYYYKVRGFKTVNGVKVYGDYSAVKSAKPYLTTPTVTAKRYSYSSNKISWNGILGATGYKVYRATSKNGTYSWIATKGKDVRSYIDTKRTTGKTYYYKVRAYRTVNKSPVYSAYSAVKYATPTLSKVATVKTAKAGTRKIKVTWSGVSGATGYKVYRSTKSTSGYTAVKTVKAGKTRAYASGKLTKNKRYYFKVRAYRVVNGKTVYGPYSTAVYRTAK